MDKIEDLCEKLTQMKTVKFSLPVVSQVYSSGFSKDKLDKAGYLENFLLKELKDNLNHHYFMSIVQMINYKLKDTIFVWDYLQNHSAFQKLIEFLIQQDLSKFSDDEILDILDFLSSHFSRLEHDFINKGLLNMVSAPLLLQVPKTYLKSYVLSYPHLITLVEKLFKNEKKVLTQETQFIQKLFTLLIKSQNVKVMNKIIMLFCELLGTIQTRKFLKPYLKGNFLIPLLNHKKIQSAGKEQHFLIRLLQKLINYDLNDETGEPLTENHILLIKSDFFKKLQIFLFKKFDEQLSLKQIETLQFINYFEDQIKDLIVVFNYMNIPVPENQSIDFLVEVFRDFIPQDIDRTIENEPLIPTEKQIFSEETPSLLKLNLQFLSINDYLTRNFQLLKLESCFEIKQDITDCVEKMSPVYSGDGRFMCFNGWARMGLALRSIQFQEVKAPEIGKKIPQRVFAEIHYSVSGLPNYLRKEWESLRKYDVVFVTSFQNKSLEFVRGAEVIAHLDDQRNDIEKEQKGNDRILQVHFDRAQYAKDFEEGLSEMIYGSMKLLVRRKAKENNFKSALASIQDMIVNPVQVPEFLKDSILGYGEYEQKINPAHFEKINLYDTFLSKKHFTESFEKNELLPEKLRKSKHFAQNSSYEKPNQIEFTKQQTQAIVASVQPGLTLIKGPPGTGKTDVIVQAIALLYRNFPDQRILVITHSNQALNDIFEKIRNMDTIEEHHLLRLGMQGQKLFGKDKDFSFGRMGRINHLLQRRIDLLEKAKILAHSIEFMEENFTCETANIFYQSHIQPRIQKFHSQKTAEFGNYLEDTKEGQKVEQIEQLFEHIRELRFLELMRNNTERGDSFQCKMARIVAMTVTHAALKREKFLKMGFTYDSLVSEEQGQILEISSFIAMNLSSENKLKRVILVGDDQQLPPIIKNNQLQMIGNMEQSLFKRFIRHGFNVIELQHQGRTRPQILSLYQWKYPSLQNLPNVIQEKASSEFGRANIGMKEVFQFVDVKGRESQPNPFFYQNLEEAEYVVALFMYLRLKGVPADKITILTTYNGQKFLIRDIIHQKCSWNTYFQRPHKIQTVDKYQGQQNDFVLLSLVRTHHVGHLRDPRRLVVAMSRARLGLYVFGNLSLFDGYPEMQTCFDEFKKKNTALEIIQDETEHKRLAKDKVNKALAVQDAAQLYEIVKSLLEKQISNL